MRSFRRILVAVKDVHASDLPAVDKAAQLARASGAHLELFHDMDVPVFADTSGTDPGGFRGMARALRARALEGLERIATPLRKKGIEVSTTAVWDFPAYEAIVRRATASRADLIVAECQPGRRRAPLLLRLTDWELLRYSPLPVLLVKTPGPYARPVILSAVDPAHAHAKPTKLDDEILATSLAVKNALRGTLHAVHSYDPLPVSAAPADMLSSQTWTRLERYQQRTAQSRLRKAVARAGLPPARQHVICASARDAIQRAVRELGCSIVVMGAVSRTGLKRLLIGNTAERLLDELSCDVLVVKPRRFKNRVPRARNGMRLVTPEPLFVA